MKNNSKRNVYSKKSGEVNTNCNDVCTYNLEVIKHITFEKQVMAALMKYHHSTEAS